MIVRHIDPERLDLNAIVHAPLRRRSRLRAAINLALIFGFPGLFVAGLLWLAGAMR